MYVMFVFFFLNFFYTFYQDNFLFQKLMTELIEDEQL